MMPSRRVAPMAALVAALGILLHAPAPAQSLQRWAVQGSAAVIFPFEEPAGLESDVRIGYDVQVRYTLSRWSIGAGYQRSPILQATSGDLDVALAVGFLEPRYVLVAGSRAALYLAGRVGAGRLSCSPDRCDDEWHVTLGGGSGVLFSLSSRLAIDVGAQVFTVADAANSNYFTARLGLGLGL